MSNDTTTTTKCRELAREVLVEKYNAVFAERKAAVEKADAKLAAIVADIGAIDSLANIAEGSAVLIKVGKSAVEVQGKVLAIRVEADGTKSFNVAYGAGFDATTAVVKEGRIRLVPPAPAAEDGAQTQA